MAATSTALRINSAQMAEAVDKLKEAVSYPSISNKDNPDYNPTALKAAVEFYKSLFDQIGFTSRLVKIGDAPEYLISESPNFDPAKETADFYYHYDVQPVDKPQWKSDPFKAEVREGRLYGRGASDDKGGGIAIWAALKAYQTANGKFPVNIRIISEGEEEVGSDSMPAFLQQEAKNLPAKAFVIVDGGNKNKDNGTLCFATGGIVNVLLEMQAQKDPRTPPQDRVYFNLEMNALELPTHSGIGCLAPDPCMALTDLVNKTRGATLEKFHCGKENGSNSIQDKAICTISLPAAAEKEIRDFILNHKNLYNCQVKVMDSAPPGTAAAALCSLVSALQDPGKIPGFMDGAIPLNEQERDLLRANTQTEQEYAHEVHALPGVDLRGDPKKSVYERVMETPNLSILNFTSHRPGKEYAQCMVSARIKPGQDPHKVSESIMNFIQQQKLPAGCTLTMTEKAAAWGWKADLSRPYSNKYFDALKENFAGKVCIMPTAGALPLCTQIQEAIPGIEIIVPGVEDDKTSAHSHNESQDLGLLEKQTNTIMSFLDKLGK